MPPSLREKPGNVTGLHANFELARAHLLSDRCPLSPQNPGAAEASLPAPSLDGAAAPVGGATGADELHNASGDDHPAAMEPAAGSHQEPATDGGHAVLSAPAAMSPPESELEAAALVPEDRPLPGSGGGLEETRQPGESAAVGPDSLTAGSDGRRGSGGGRRGSGSLGGARQTPGSEITFGALLADGRKRSSSQADGALSKLPPVGDIAAEVPLLPPHPRQDMHCSPV